MSIESPVRGPTLAWPLLAFVVLGGLLVIPTAQDPARDPAEGTGEPAGVTRSGTSAVVSAVHPALDLLAEALGASGKTLGVVHKACQERDVAVEFLVVLVPDPASQVRYTFDGITDAVRRAAVASGYQFDRVRLPEDWTKSTTPVDVRRGPRTAGAVLFRKEDGELRQLSRFLVVLLVPEAPSRGVDLERLRDAADLIARWSRAQDPGRPPEVTLRILGPNFSGSAPGLAAELGALGERLDCEFAKERPPCPVKVSARVVSGSATRADNRRVFEAHGVHFRATVLPDDAVLQRLYCYFLDAADTGGRIALLMEASAYGAGAQGKGKTLPECEDRTLEEVAFQFPMHISRLRSASGESSPSESAAFGSPALVRLRLAESESPVDGLPTLTPELTSAEVEVQLAGTFEAIRRARLSTIGLIATDMRDKLFLAREVARHAPNSMIFTLESDLAFVHPEHGPYIRGAVVASSYPLFPGAFTTGRQFTSTNAQGVYNAALALLWLDREGKPLQESPPPPPLLDYAAPGTTDCRNGCLPALWISVVGRDGIWPLRAARIQADKMDGQVQPYFGPMAPASIADAIHPSLPVLMFFVGTTVLSAVHGGAFLRNWRKRRADFRGSEDGFHHARYALCCLAPLALIAAFQAWVFALWVRTSRDTGVIEVALGAAAIIIGSIVAICTAIVVRHLVTHTEARTIRWRRSLGFVLGGGAVFAASCLALYLGCTWQADEARGALWLERTVHPANWVSPLIPTVLVLAPIYGWGLFHLWWMRRSSLRDIAETVGMLGPMVTGGTGKDGERPLWWLQLYGHDRGPMSCASDKQMVVLCAAVVAVFAAWYTHGLGSIEGSYFAMFFAATWVLAQALLGVTIVQSIACWFGLHAWLRGMANHRMIDAFTRIPKGRFSAPLSLAPPRSLELEFLARQAAKIDAGTPNALEVAADLSNARPHEWMRTRTYKRLRDIAVTHLAAVSDRAFPEPLRKTQEEFLASFAVFHVREILCRILQGLALVVVAEFVMLASHVFFPSQSRSLLITVTWLAIFGVLGVAWMVFLQAERSEVLRRVTDRTPREITFDLVRQFVVYGVLPLLTYFAVQFPEVGATFLQWLQPLQRGVS